MNKIYTLLILSILTGCIVIVPNFTGLKSGYKKLSPNQKARIKFVNDREELTYLNKNDTIYAITSNHIKTIIENEKSDVVLYLWSANCSSEVCHPIEYVREMCSSKNQKLIVVMEYYDFELVSFQNTESLDFPLFSINTKHYETDFCNKYTKRFITDLLNKGKLKDEELYNRYFLFLNGKYVGAKSDIIKL
ncbi:hypothetical protein [Brumimicrobium oceani]|uniref:Uncharacterized protein n=1 Tax=Brumimicrobium oceani TaxID=2100725 RepID=A0A2U2X0E4_9FLAO|nr:hypothetical protein [Brumimicrobium oceani]PWH81224.1 hypothetical protein DIT68_15935 [Brumimicrobium oceani]